MPPLRVAPRPYLSVFPLLYLGVFAAGAYYDVAGLCGGFSGARLAGLTGALLLPLALELFERRRYGSHAPRAAAAALLVGRMLLFELVAANDCSGFSKFLYLILPFTAYFLDRRLSYALALGYVGLVVVRLWAWNPLWYRQGNYLSDVLIFAIGLAFAIAMARAVSAAEASRRRAEGLLDDLARSHAQLRQYAAQAAGLAAAEERNRLARDIHDSLGHYLAVISVQLEKALAFRQRDPQAADKAVADARHAAREALHDVRQSVGALRDDGETFVLAEALAGLAQGLDGETLRVSVQVAGAQAGYPRPALLALYRATQEGLTNVQKHAQATLAEVRLTLDEHAASLVVSDNGRGVEVASLAGNGHYGLQGMRERLALVGGTLQVHSAPGQGTTLRVTIPKVSTVAPEAGGP